VASDTGESFPVKDLYIYSFISASIVVLALLGYPVYFRSDDIGYFTWVRSHPNLIDCFIPGRNYLFAGHRPLTMLYWWLIFNLFGMDQTVYQIVMPALLILSVVFLHRLSKLLFGPRVGLFTVMVFLLIFNRYFNVLFWYSNINNLMEPCLAVMGCYFIARAFYTNGLVSKLPAILFSTGAIFTKEPSMGIISTFIVGLLLSFRARFANWKKYLFLVPILLVVAYEFLITPAWSIRFASYDQASVEKLIDNYLFYADSLAGGFLGLTLLILFFYLVTSSLCARLFSVRTTTRLTFWQTPIFFLLLSILLGLSDPILFHLPFLVALFAALWLAFGWERSHLPFILWFAVVFFLLLGLKNHVATNLFNSTYGLAVLLGISAERAHRELKAYLPELLKSRKGMTAGLVATTIVVVILAGNQIAFQYKALKALKNTRQNFKDVTDFIVDKLPAGSELFLVDYGSLGSEYRREVMGGNLLEKARYHKTMRIEYMQPLLDLCGRPDIRVRALKEVGPDLKADSYALPANIREHTFLMQVLHERGIETKAVFSVGRGADSAGVYELLSSPKASEHSSHLRLTQPHYEELAPSAADWPLPVKLHLRAPERFSVCFVFPWQC
jgi:hypothetical protein